MYSLFIYIIVMCILSTTENDTCILYELAQNICAVNKDTIQYLVKIAFACVLS